VSSTAPGPGLLVIPQLPRLRRDPLGAMLDYHREYGDIVRLGDGSFSVHLLGHPELAEHVLRRNHRNYDRQTRSADAVRVVTGESLMTNDGDAWKHHRLLMQPLFNEDALDHLRAITIDATNAMVDRWRGTLDIVPELVRLTSTITARALFGADVDSELVELMPLVFEETYARATAVLPFRIASRKFHRALDHVRATVDRIIELGDSPLLTKLRELDPEEMRSEVIALLLSGHETTANVLAWTFALMKPGDPPRESVQEAMRLYPPVWIVERRAIEDDEIAGYTIPADSIVYVSPYVLHRHRDFWTDAERFDPTRFPEAEHNDAYLPFGAGPHRCIGAAFAMIQAPLVIETVLTRCTLTLADDARIEPHPLITLRPRFGVRMECGSRAAALGA